MAVVTAGAMAIAIGSVSAQQRRPAPAPQPKGEAGLIGIKLYDTGLRLVQVFGSPNEIQAVGVGGGTIGPVGGGGGGGGNAPAGSSRGGGAMSGPGRSGGGGPSIAPEEGFNTGPGELGFAGELFRQGVAGGAELSPNMGGTAPASSPGGSAGGGKGGGGMMGGGGGGADVKFTRWVYNRSGSKYAFVIDKYNHVVQIEAVGISDAKVRSARGIRFGSSFSQILKSYGAPDGYEISGDNIVVKYLQRNKIAFRLSRLGKNKPHVVTGIVVAGGKA